MKENMYDEDTIDLLELARVLLKKWWLILLSAVFGGALALLVTITMINPQYQSNAMLYILSKTTTVTSLADLQLGSELTADFEVIAKSKPVLDSAIEKLKTESDKKFTRDELNQMLSVSNKSDTRILVISATSTDPTDASLVANAVAEATAEQMAYIMKSDEPTTVEKAEVESTPVSPSLKKNLLMGILAGMVLACGVLVVGYLMNDTINTEDDIKRYLDAPTLIIIPAEKVLLKKKNEDGNKEGEVL